MTRKRPVKRIQKLNQSKQTPKIADSKELILIEKQVIGNEEINSVDARELWKFLEIKKQFTDWIRPKIKDYGFVINSDFYPSLSIAPNGRKMETYIISVDMAKELSMLSQTTKGKEARKYFIEMEKIAKKETPNFANPAEAARAWADEYEQKLILEETNKEIQKELEYKKEALDGICKSISLETQRQVLNKVVRYKGSDFRKRWHLLYDHFNRTHHMNLTLRMVQYNATHNPKVNSKLDFVEYGLEMLPELYAIALKLYESDINDIIKHYTDIY